MYVIGFLMNLAITLTGASLVIWGARSADQFSLFIGCLSGVWLLRSVKVIVYDVTER